MSDAQDACSGSPLPARRPRRRWYQFGLRALFLLMTAIIGLLVLWRIYVEPYRRQREAMAVIKRLGGTFETSQAAAWQRWIMGNDFEHVTLINLADCDKVHEFLPHIAHLPRLQTLILGGPNVNDDVLNRLQLQSLRLLMLDSSWETEEGIVDFRCRFPNVEVCHSERRALESLRDARFEVESQVVEDTQLKAVAGPQFNVKIVRVVARGTRIDSSLTSLRGCRHVGYLYLTGTDVTDTGLTYLENLQQLEGLYLANTAVTDNGLRHLAALRKLRWLNLSATRIGDAGLSHLAPLTSLEMLWLPLASATPNGIARLQASLPNCTVFAP